MATQSQDHTDNTEQPHAEQGRSRRAYAIEELPEEYYQALKNADYGPIDPELEKLMD